MEGSARAGGGGASPSASGPLPFGAALRSVAPLRSFGRPSRFGSFVRALRLRLSFVARRSLVGARVALRRDRRGAPPFGRVPFSGVPPPRAVARLPRSLPLSSLLSPTRVLLSPRARRPSSLPPLRARPPRRLSASNRQPPRPRGLPAARTPDAGKGQPPERPEPPRFGQGRAKPLNAKPLTPERPRTAPIRARARAAA